MSFPAGAFRRFQGVEGVIRRFAAFILAASIPSSSFAQVVRIPSVSAPVAAATAAGAGIGATASEPGFLKTAGGLFLPSHLPTDYFAPKADSSAPGYARSAEESASSAAGAAEAPVSGFTSNTAEGRVSFYEENAEFPASADGAVVLKSRSPTLRYGHEFPGRMPGDLPATLSQMFDGKAEATERLPAPAVYVESLFGEAHIADARYSTLVSAARRHLFPDHMPRSGREKVQRLKGGYDILETVRRTDADTFSHLLRVGLMAGLVTLRLGFDARVAEYVAWAATLHDVGKLDKDVLKTIRKRGKLTDAERKVMQRHTMIGSKILSRMADVPKDLRKFASVVALNHHETVDGKGYPRGLRAEQISLASRITSVVDFFDALMENRPYRKGMTIEKALKIMDEERSKFDPDVFAAFKSIVSLAFLPQLTTALLPYNGLYFTNSR